MNIFDDPKLLRFMADRPGRGVAGTTLSTSANLMNPAVRPAGQQDLIGQLSQRDSAEEKDNKASMIGKAFSSLGKALDTPGFQQILGRIAAATAAPGSWQQGAGMVGAEIGRGRQYSSIMQKMLSGQQITEEDVRGMSAEDLQAIEQNVLKKRELDISEKRAEDLGEYYKGMVEKQESPAQRYTREMDVASLRTMMRQDPGWQPIGSTGYVMNKATGEVVKRFTPEDRASQMTEGQQLTNHRWWYNQFVDMAYRDPRIVKRMEVIENPDGSKTAKFKNPEEDAKVLMDVTREYIQRGVETGLIPESYLTTLPEQLLGDELSPELQDIVDRFQSGQIDEDKARKEFEKLGIPWE